MNKFLFVIFLFGISFFGCSNDDEVGNEKIPEEFKNSYLGISILLEGVNVADFYKGCYINSILDKIPISDGTMKLQSNINNKVQSYFLTDGNDNIYMMTRVSDTGKNKALEFDSESTALAFVTLHPFFASIDNQAYDILKEVILQSKNFSKVCTEVKHIIKQKKDLYDQNNTALLDALGLLLDELIVFANYKPEAESTSRALTNETGYYPFRLNSSGNRLDFQVFGLNPNYYGTATHANGNTERLVVQSHDDFGFLAGLESVWNVLNKRGWDANQYGEIESYTFPADGECQFHFSCNTQENQRDLILKLLGSASDILGIDVDDLESGLEGMGVINDLAQEINNAGYKFETTTFPYYSLVDDPTFMDVVDKATDLLNGCIEGSYEAEIKTYEKLKEKTNNQNIQNVYDSRISNLKKSQALYKKLMGTYSFIKAIGNITTRLAAAQWADEPVDFKLCCYNNEIRNCSQIRKYKGDNQTGIYGTELDEPISVMVNVNMESLADYVVKFEVARGSGSVGDSESTKEYVEISDCIASVKWVLGTDSEEQIVRACLCEKETKEEVCEPVEFKATAEPEQLAIYIENITYDESPFYNNGTVTFEPTLIVSTDETEKLENLYDWGLILYKDDSTGGSQEIERIRVGKDYNSVDFSKKFTLEKSDMDIDYTNYIAKNDETYSIGTYVVYQAGGEEQESEMVVPIELVYDQKPEITIKNLVNGTCSQYEDNLYLLNYVFDLELSGALFFDVLKNCGETEMPTFYKDGIFLINGSKRPFGIKQVINDTHYFTAIINGMTIISNHIKFHNNGDGSAYAYLSN